MTAFDLSGRQALVTGANRGIGRAIALGLARQGADVCVHCHHDLGEADDVADLIASTGRRSCVVAGDLARPGEATRVLSGAAEALGAEPDLLIANAAIEVRQEFGAITWEAAGRQFGVNFMSVIELIQAAVPGMRARGGGRIVTIGSIQQMRPNPQLVVYAALKAALANAVRNLARQLAPDQITINNVIPGVILTEMNREVLTDAGYRAKLKAGIPLDAFGTPEDCVGAVLLFCAPEGRYMTGSELVVDGGMQL